SGYGRTERRNPLETPPARLREARWQRSREPGVLLRILSSRTIGENTCTCSIALPTSTSDIFVLNLICFNWFGSILIVSAAFGQSQAGSVPDYGIAVQVRGRPSVGKFAVDNVAEARRDRCPAVPVLLNSSVSSASGTLSSTVSCSFSRSPLSACSVSRSSFREATWSLQCSSPCSR